MKPSSLLLVDDERDILDMLQYNLEQEGYKVYTADNGIDGLALARKVNPDLMILDIMMPGMDGVELCQKIRKDDGLKDSVVAFLTARDEDYSQIAGFEAGADDYIAKPVKPRVLVSRVKALLKRSSAAPKTDSRLEHNGIVVDLDKVSVTHNNSELHLPKKEFELLTLLISKPGKVFKRTEIYDSVWGRDQYVGDRTIDVHIRKLREKLGNELIQTVKGVGYKFREQSSVHSA